MANELAGNSIETLEHHQGDNMLITPAKFGKQKHMNHHQGKNMFVTPPEIMKHCQNYESPVAECGNGSIAIAKTRKKGAEEKQQSIPTRVGENPAPIQSLFWQIISLCRGLCL